MLVRALDVLDHVEAVNAVIPFRQRRRDDVVQDSLQRPAVARTRQNVLDEYRIEIVDGDLVHLLLDDARAEGIAATDLRDIAASAQHL